MFAEPMLVEPIVKLERLAQSGRRMIGSSKTRCEAGFRSRDRPILRNSLLFWSFLIPASNDEPHFGPIGPPQKQLPLIDAALNYRTGLPIFRQHFMRVPRLALCNHNGSRGADSNLEVRIFMIDGSVDHPVYNPVSRLSLGSDDGQRHGTALDRKRARSQAREQ